MLTVAQKATAAAVADAVRGALDPPTGPSPDKQGEPYQQLVFVGGGTSTSDAVYTVTGDLKLWPLSVMCRLTCSAVVADRSVALEYRDPDGNRYLVAGTQAIVQANGTQSFGWHPEAGDVTWPVEDAALAPLPQQFLYPGYQLAVKIWNGQVGDVLDQVRMMGRFQS